MITLKRIDANINLSDAWYRKSDGKMVKILERDVDDVVYEVDGKREKGVATIDIVKIGQLSGFKALLNAIKTNPAAHGNRRKDAGLGLHKNGSTVVIFDGQVCVRFFKQGGHTPYYAPVSDDDAESILNGFSKLMYVKRSSRFQVVPA
jgi:hypothetical protein